MARPRSDIQPRIVHAARQRFLSEGVDGASLRTIARDAGTSIGMVSYYFPTKDDLFFAVVDEIYQRLLQDITHTLEVDPRSPTPLPAKERLRRMFTRLGSLDDDELTTVRLVVREVLVSSSRLDRLTERFQRGHIPIILQTLADGVREGSIDSRWHPGLLLVATTAMGAVPQFIHRIAGARLPLGALPAGEPFANQLVDALFDGIGRAQEPSKPRRRG
jgi:AcrR family transcriptional regulator